MQSLIEKVADKQTEHTKYSKTIFEKILKSILLILFVEVILLLGSVFLTGLIRKLKENAEEIFVKQVENRSVYVKNLLLDAQELSSFEKMVTEHTQKYLSEGKLTIDQLDHVTETTELLGDICEEMIEEMRTRTVNGMFVIFNTQNLQELTEGTNLPCIYVRDLDPEAAASKRNEDLSFEFAPSEVIRSMKIYTDACWKPSFSYTKNKTDMAFIQQPFQAAYHAAEHEEELLSYDSYGYWTTTPFCLTGDTREIITYSIPLILEDGTVYGVAGIELQTSYLEEKISCEELGYESAGYVLAYSSTELRDSGYVARRVIASTENEAWTRVGGVLNVKTEDGDSAMYVKGADYFVYSVPLNLYSRNAPFSKDHWVLMAAVDKLQLYELATTIQNLFVLISGLMLLLGFVCSIIVSHTISIPIINLSEKISEFEKKDMDTIPKLPGTGIQELDYFSASFTRLGRNILDSSTRFLKIIEMASIRLGGYEVRYKLNKAYVTNDYFSLLGMENPYGQYMSATKFNRLMMQFYASAKVTYQSEDGSSVFEILNEDGTVRYIRLMTVVEDEARIGIAEDVTTSEVERQRLQKERDYDVLTGLWNRKAFLSKLSKLFLQPKQLKNAVLIAFDTDNLKKINDTYGHDWGDRYLCTVARYIRETLPPETICAHVSGDEFVAFLYGYEEEEELISIVEMFQASVPYRLDLPDGRVFPVSISSGVARYPQDSEDAKVLQKYADFAMYQVKRSQKGTLQWFDKEAHAQEQRENKRKKAFHTIMKTQEGISYHFQPIVSAKNGEVAAYEALLRVDASTMLTIDDIVTMASEKNRLYDLEKMTWTKALEAFAVLQDADQTDKKLFINSIANVYLKQKDFDACKPLLEKFRNRIVVEITEGEKLDAEVLKIKKEQVQGLASFALDDYGSGYSNSISLLELSPEYIKIDAQIIHDIHLDAGKQQIVQNIILYAAHRKMKVIAEGIEQQEELDCVLQLGVDMVQGYLIGHPKAMLEDIPIEIKQNIAGGYHI